MSSKYTYYFITYFFICLKPIVCLKPPFIYCDLYNVSSVGEHLSCLQFLLL